MKRCRKCKSLYGDELAFCPQDGVRLRESSPWVEGSEVAGRFRIIYHLKPLTTYGWFEDFEAVGTSNNKPRLLRAALWLPADTQFETFLTWENEFKAFTDEFEREFRRLSQFHHPGAQQVEEVEKAQDTRVFAVLESLRGETVRQRLDRSGPIPLQSTIGFAWQIASALGAAHQLGIFRGEVLPEKILLVNTPQEVAAKLLQDFADLTRIDVSLEAQRLEGTDLAPPQHLEATYLPMGGGSGQWGG